MILGASIALRATFSWLSPSTWAYSVLDPDSAVLAIVAPSGAVTHLTTAAGTLAKQAGGAFVGMFTPTELGVHVASVSAALGAITSASKNVAFSVTAHAT